METTGSPGETAGSARAEKAASASAKAALRARMRTVRGALTAEERADQSARACMRLLALPAMREARAAALYWPIGDELDVRPALRALAGRGVQVALPVTLTGRRIAFALADEALLDRIVPADPRATGPNAGAVPAWLAHPSRPLVRMPGGLAPIDPADLDVIVVPGLAFDTGGRRLGYGGGYYDTLLGGLRDAADSGRRRPLACGIGFDFQLLGDGTLPVEPHDAALDCVVVPARLARTGGRRVPQRPPTRTA